MINKTNFLEPTPEYCKEFEGMSHDTIKDWFNVDLIFMAHHYAKDIEENVKGFKDFYDSVWRGIYNIKLTIEEVQEQFKEYSEETVSEMMPELIKSMKDLRIADEFDKIIV